MNSTFYEFIIRLQSALCQNKSVFLIKVVFLTIAGDQSNLVTVFYSAAIFPWRKKWKINSRLPLKATF